MKNESFQILIKAIIVSQQAVVGPLAVQTANKVTGLKISSDLGSVDLSGDENKILENLVHQYKTLFGQASVEVCKDAVRPIVAKMKDISIPQILL